MEGLLETIPKIRVVIRKRPLGTKELARKDKDIVEIRDGSVVSVRELKTKVDLTKYIEENIFTFDNSFGEDSENEELYEAVVRPIVYAAFHKAKVTCFAYGQTGSGKTFTMMGDLGKKIPGLYLMAVQDLFTIRDQSFKDITAWISFYEIYCEKAYDLLNKRNGCFIRVDAKENVHIVGLSERQVESVDSLMEIIQQGLGSRMTSQTGMNDQSSRSHAILQIILRNHNNKIHGKMSFIDLAGSERGADVKDSQKQTRNDGAEINKSLLALKECIRALDMDKKHTPFRGSKLTLVLKDSFIGHCKTVMIGNISPAESSCEQTLNTLRYADRVKELKKPGDRAPANQAELLAKELMLPRLGKSKNVIKITEKTMTTNMIGLDGNVVNKKNEDDPYGIGVIKKNTSATPSDTTPKQNSTKFTKFQEPQKPAQPIQPLPSRYPKTKGPPTDPLFDPEDMGDPEEEVEAPPFRPMTRQQQKPSTGQLMTSNINYRKTEGNPNPRFGNKFPEDNSYQEEQPSKRSGKDNTLLFSTKEASSGEREGPNRGNNRSGHIFDDEFDMLDNSRPSRQTMGGTRGSTKALNQLSNLIQSKGSKPPAPKPVTREEVEQLQDKRERLVETIVIEEENIMDFHKQFIDSMIGCIKQNSETFQSLTEEQVPFDDYILQLNKELEKEERLISKLKMRLEYYNKKVKEEEELRKKLQTLNQDDSFGEVFDLRQSKVEDFGLLDD